ncbi:MAG TPA: FG-GAP repeat protein, partial [Blastocatellia bacterium]
MISARLQRFCFFLFVSISIIASLCLLLWLMSKSTSHAATGTMFSQLQKLTAPDGTADDFFGTSVAIDGDTAVVGSSPVGKVYVFFRTDGVWSLQQTLTPSVSMGEAFGISVAISGDTIVAGAISSTLTPGSAYVFVRSGGVWTEQQRLLASDGVNNDNFGISVGISGDTVVVSARFHGAGPHPEQGSAYVYARTSGVWSEQ